MELDGDHAFSDCGSRRPWRAAPRTLATCAATRLPKRAGVPPAATWSVQPERILHLLPRLPPVGLCGVEKRCQTRARPHPAAPLSARLRGAGARDGRVVEQHDWFSSA